MAKRVLFLAPFVKKEQSTTLDGQKEITRSRSRSFFIFLPDNSVESRWLFLNKR